jgi:hypothetical protein
MRRQADHEIARIGPFIRWSRIQAPSSPPAKGLGPNHERRTCGCKQGGELANEECDQLHDGPFTAEVPHVVRQQHALTPSGCGLVHIAMLRRLWLWITPAIHPGTRGGWRNPFQINHLGGDGALR